MKNGEKNKAIRVAIEVKLSLFTGELIIFVENLMEFIKTLLELVT